MSEPNFDRLKLENQLCFPLYAASRGTIKKYRPFLEPLGLTYTQYIVMLVLWEHRKTDARAMGERLYLDSGTLTPVLKSLEAKGLLKRYRSSADERVLMVELTEQGEALKEKAQHIPVKLAACIQLKPEETLQLYNLLYKLLDTTTEAE